MSGIHNNPTIEEHTINLLRAAIEHRATWMALMYEEAEKMGIDAEKMVRNAIRKCGHIHGENIKNSTKNKDSLDSFGYSFVNEETIKNFEMKFKERDNDKLYIEFNYCPLVNAWKKLGLSDEKIELLCDIAMEGDRGIAETMGYNFNLLETIAKCNKTCKVNFNK